jgi:MFS family permease
VTERAGPARGAASIFSELDMRLATPLMIQTIFVHCAVTIGRVATSYKVVELDLSVVWVGAMSGAFSLLPALLAVPVGRFIDRGHDSLATWVGSALLVIATFGYWLFPATGLSLLFATGLLGVGQLGCMAGHQMIAVRACKTTRGRDAVFGYHMVAIAAGQGLAPLIIAWVAGGARIPPTDTLFLVGVLAAVASLAIGFALTPAPREPAGGPAKVSTKLRELIGIPGLMAYVMASVITITGLDVIVVYLPLLGVERGIDAGTIGLLMTLRALSSMAARLVFVPLIDFVGRMPLTYATMLSPAAAFALIAAPVPLWLMYPAVIVCGVGLGISATLTLSGVVEVAPPNARATAISLRLTGNRAGLVFIPFLAGVVASATGLGGVFLVVSSILVASTGGVWAGRKRRGYAG